MSDLSIELSQIDRSDTGAIKNILLVAFKDFFDSSSDFCGMNIPKWVESEVVGGNHSFAIRVSKVDSRGVAAGRTWVVGICGIKNINWSSRTGELFFAMIDKDGHRQTIQNYSSTQTALNNIIRYAFNELGLNKLWTTHLDNNDISEILVNNGFTLEGIRASAVFVAGKYRNQSVYALTMKDFLERSK